MVKRILLFLFICCSISQFTFAQGWVIVFNGFPVSSQCSSTPTINAGITFNSSANNFNFSGISTLLAPVTDSKGNSYMGIISGTGNLNAGSVDPSINFLFVGSSILPHTEFYGNGTFLGASFYILPFWSTNINNCILNGNPPITLSLNCSKTTTGSVSVLPRIQLTKNRASCGYSFDTGFCPGTTEYTWQVNDNPANAANWRTISGKTTGFVSIQTKDLPLFNGSQYGARYIRAIDPRFPGKRDSEYKRADFYPPPPTISMLASTVGQPSCPSGPNSNDGSITIAHSSITSGEKFIYSVTQYVPKVGTDACPNISGGSAERTFGTPAVSYCKGYKANFINDAGVTSFPLSNGNKTDGTDALFTFRPGWYTVVIESKMNKDSTTVSCPSLEYAFEVRPPPVMTVSLTSGPFPPSCKGGNDGSALFTIANGKGSFSWKKDAESSYTALSTGIRSFSISAPIATGNHTIEVLDTYCNLTATLLPSPSTFNIPDNSTPLGLSTASSPETNSAITCYDATGKGDAFWTVRVESPNPSVATGYKYSLYKGSVAPANAVAGKTNVGDGLNYKFIELGVNTYVAEVVAPNGCKNIISQTFTLPSPLSGDPLQYIPACPGNTDAKIIFTKTGGSSSLSFTVNGISKPATASLNVYTISNVASASNIPIVVTDNCLPLNNEAGLIGVKSYNNSTIPQSSPLVFDESASNVTPGQIFNLSCFGNTASRQISFQNGRAPYSVSIAKDGTPYGNWNLTGNTILLPTLTANNTPSPNYVVSITDNCPDVIARTFRVQTPPAILATITPTNLTCNGNHTGTIQVQLSGGAPGLNGDGIKNYIVRLYNNNTQTEITGSRRDCGDPTNENCVVFSGLDENLPYRVEATDFNTDAPPCTKVFNSAVDIKTLSSPQPLGVRSYVGADFSGHVEFPLTSRNIYATCKDDAIISFTPKVDGGTGPYTFYLAKEGTPPYPLPYENITSGSFNGLGAGNYQVSVSDVNNCPSTPDNFQIQQASSPIQVSTISAALFPNGANTECYGSSDGSITITATGGATGDGVGNYTYELSSDNPFNTSISKSASSHTFPSLPAIKTNGDTITYTVALRDDLGCYWSMTNGVDEQLKLSPPDTVEFAWSVASKNFPGYEIPCRGDDAIIRVTSEGGMYPHQITINGVTQQLSSTNDHVDFPLSATTITHYTATFKDNLDCPAPNQLIALTEPASHVAVTVGTIIPPVCINGTDGEIHLSATGGIQFTSPDQYKFIIKRSSIALFDTDTLRGTTVNFRRPANYFVSQNYDVMTIDKHGCIDNASLTMPPNPAPLTLTVNTLVSPSCHGGNDGYITVTASNYNFIGGTSLKFKLSGGHLGNTIIERVVAGETITFTGLEGTDLNGYTGYRAWVEDANSCQDTAYQYLDQSQLQLPSYTPVSVSLLKSIRPSCLNGVDGSLHVQVSGGVPPYKYSLDNLTFTNVNPNGKIFINNLVRESYKFYVTDANFLATQPSCLDTASFSVNKGREIQLTPVMITPVSCVGSNDGAIDLSVTVINRDEDFERSRLKLYWTHDNISSTTSIDTTQDISSLSAGRYTVHASYFVDTLSCTNQKSITIQQPGNGSFRISNITTYDATCGGLTNDGRVVVTVVGGWANIPSYYKLDGGNSQLFSNASFILTGLSPGAHTIEILQANSVCRDVGSFTIEAAMLPLAHHPVRNPSCPLNADGSVRLYSTTANVLFAQEGSNFQSSDEFAGLAAGTYRFVARKIGVNTCVSDPIEVIVADPVDCGTGALSLQLATTPVNATCATVQDGQAQVMASGGVPPYKFYWDGSTTPAPGIPNNLTSSASNSLAIGTHTIKVYDAVNNSATVSLTIASLDLLEVLNSTTKTSCANTCNGTAQLLINGGSGAPIINWTDGSGLSTINRQDLCAGEHTFTITDGLNNACSFSGNVLIEHQPDLQIDQLEMIPPVCPGGTDGYINTDVYGGSGDLTITWTNGLPGKKLHGYAAGNYTISVTDNVFGCSKQSTFTLPDAAPITVSSISTTPPRCYGGNDGSTQLSFSNVSSPLVQWSNGQIGLTASRLKAGTYEYTVTGSNGCIITGNATLIERPALTVTPAATMPTCFGSCNGSASITISGGVSPYSIHWSHGPRTSSLVNLCAGNYSYTVTDNFNCQVTGTVSITAPTDIVITKKSEITPLCYGNSNGSLTIEASGGTGAYNYRWTSNQLSPTITGLAAGDYSVTVTDANLCSRSKTFTLTTPSALFFQQDKITQPLCQQSMDGQIIPNPVGGTTPFTFLWENQSSAIVRNQLTAGQYSLQVTDAKGCVVKKNYSLEAPLALEIVNVILLDPVCFDNKNGSISLQAIGGAKPYSFLWNNGAGSMAIKEIGAGNYSVKATDKNGCTIADSYTLKNPQAPIITGIPQKIVICIGSPTTIEPDGDWSTYHWTGPQKFDATTKRIETELAGNYSLTAMDVKGCPALANFSIEASKDALIADFLRISEAIVFQPVVFVDISLPEPSHIEWIAPDDKDVVINSQSNGNVEILFTRTGTFEIGMIASMGSCSSELYKTVIVTEPSDVPGDGGGRLATEDRPMTAVVYPNPAGERVAIQVGVPSRDAVELWVISPIENREFFNEKMEGQFDYLIEWDISKLTAGVYYLIYKQHNTTRSERIAVIR